MMPWRVFVARSAAAGAIIGAAVTGAIVLGMRLAKADPGGPTGNELTFAGVLRERVSMSTTLTFVFHRGTAASVAACTTTTAAFTPDSNGAFSVGVPLGACTNERGLFDGEAVFYDVYLGGTATGTAVASAVRVTPVPYARFADQVGVNNDCPAGYTRVVDDPNFTGDMRLCVRRRTDGTPYDEVVRVGTGASAFWIDRYEASVWSDALATAVQFGSGAAGVDDYPVTFPDNGQWTTPLHAVSYSAGGTSVPRIFPSRSLTWFQAQAACRVSGKRLPAGEEWVAAARGTVDPGPNVGNTGPCRTGAGAPRQTGLGRNPDVRVTTCISAWGAEDMIGNVWEWTSEWYAGVGNYADVTMSSRQIHQDVDQWPPDYGHDGTYNIATWVNRGDGPVSAVPAAALRGGAWVGGPRVGIFALNLNDAPSSSHPMFGFRCVIPR